MKIIKVFFGWVCLLPVMWFLGWLFVYLPIKQLGYLLRFSWGDFTFIGLLGLSIDTMFIFLGLLKLGIWLITGEDIAREVK